MKTRRAVMNLVYLASPYSHPEAHIREFRFDAACKATVALIRQGHNVFSPIVHSHPLVAHGMGGAWSDWIKIDHDWISRCDEVVVLCLEGWTESVGVRAEIEYAKSIGKPVRYEAANLCTGVEESVT